MDSTTWPATSGSSTHSCAPVVSRPSYYIANTHWLGTSLSWYYKLGLGLHYHWHWLHPASPATGNVKTQSNLCSSGTPKLYSCYMDGSQRNAPLKLLCFYTDPRGSSKLRDCSSLPHSTYISSTGPNALPALSRCTSSCTVSNTSTMADTFKAHH